LKDILLTTINAKWIHPSLALRLLKANLGSLENSCEIIEFALRQPLAEKLEPFTAVCVSGALPKIIGISVSIWNHLATIELLKELEKIFSDTGSKKPVVILGGPEVSHLPGDAELLQFADHVIRGESEIAFRELCEEILGKSLAKTQRSKDHREENEEIKSAYHLYTDGDVKKKIIYVEASRGCPFKCDFCLSALENTLYEFPLDQFLADMEILIQRGVKTFKFLDRSFNINPERAIKIINFFLTKIEQITSSVSSVTPCEIFSPPFTVHFEMVPSLFPPELLQALTRFPPGTLRLEIGIQTLNPQVSERINRPSNPEKELDALRFLSEKTNAIIHADLIAGLPGEDLASFGSGFDWLWSVLCASQRGSNLEIQLGILKKLPGAPISRHDEEFKMRYNPLPPYDIEETSVFSANDIQRIKNFARFWELLVNRGLVKLENGAVFDKFLQLSDELFLHFGRNWGIDKDELIKFIKSSQFLY
jgi:radical SAM superfamily enzyme YgiQ (UPF0313 family)